MSLNDLTLTILSTLLLYIGMYNLALSSLLTIFFSNRYQTDSLSVLLTLSRNSYVAIPLILSLFSIAGIPPLGGFFAKLSLITLITTEFFVFWFLVIVVLLLLGIFFYLSNLRYLLSYSLLSTTCSPVLKTNWTWLLLTSLILLSGGLLYDDILIIITWILL